MSMTKNSIRVLAVGMVVVVTLLLSFAPSWGDTRLMIDQAANGGLNLTVCNEALCNVTVSLGSSPALISCGAPSVDWDSTVNGWVLIGCKDSGPMWTGTVTCNSYISPTSCAFAQVSTTLPPTGCSSTYPATMLISTAPASVTACTSYSWSSCTNGVMTGTGVPAGCGTGQPLVVSCNSACTSWSYGSWSPATCAAGSIQTRTATGSPSPCVGFPDQPTVQSCLVAVNGFCGSSSGGTFSTTPTAGLCTAGTASGVSGTGPWSWTCYGSNGGTNANCSANYGTAAVNGACGSSNGQTISSAPTTGLCSAGTASGVSGTGPWTWSCGGSNGGTTAQCTAYSSSVGGAAIPLTFNSGTQSFKDTLAPGAEKIYVFTVPSGVTSFSANVSSISQNAYLHILVEQGTMANIDTYYSNMAAWYKVNTKYSGLPSYSASWAATLTIPAWARYPGGLAGENVYLSQSSTNTNGASTCATLPGTYYMLVKNVSTCSTCTATYYVYAKH